MTRFSSGPSVLKTFKKHAALWFFQGALLSDTAAKLVNAQEGTTRAQRQWRFEEGDSIDEELVLRYVAEAIENEKQGKAIKPAWKKSFR